VAPVVELTAVSKRYRRAGPLVLDQISLRLNAASLIQLHGGNGSGKSTLLRVACGFSLPTHGTVHRGYSAMGVVPDRVLPPARMTARAYLAHLAQLARTPHATSTAERIADRLRLVPGLDAPMGTLSRGNLRKVILTQALMRSVDLIVMDEPFVALDPAGCAELVTIVAERLAQGCTFLIATHTDDLGSMGRVVTLEAGKLGETTRTARPAHPTDEPTVAIDLNEPHPATPFAATSAPDGAIRYRVPATEVGRFLQGALDLHLLVIRLNPVEPEVEP